MLCICGQTSEKNESSITCNGCQRNVHLDCANLLAHQVDEIYLFYCRLCQPNSGQTILNTITNSHRHNRNATNSDDLPIQTGIELFS